MIIVIQSLTRFAGAPFAQGSLYFVCASWELPLHKGAFTLFVLRGSSLYTRELFYDYALCELSFLLWGAYVCDLQGSPCIGEPFFVCINPLFVILIDKSTVP